MQSLTDQQMESLRLEVQNCSLTLAANTAMFVKNNILGRPKPTPKQQVWYLGFAGQWGLRSLSQLGLDGEHVTSFTYAVFEMIFDPIGEKIYNKALANVQKDGPFTDLSVVAANQFNEWDGGDFVPIPPTD